MRALALILLTLSSAGVACSFDLDCAIGSRCQKATGAMYGVCAGGLAPGNANDSVPVIAPLNPGVGKTCTWDLECGIGQTCEKARGALKGVCL